MLQNNNTEGLTQRRKYFPRGIIPKIAKRFHKTPNYVGMIKAGTRNNIDILEALTIEFENYTKKKNKLNTKRNRFK